MNLYLCPACSAFGRRKRNDRKVDRNPSLSVLPDWDLVEEFDLPQLLKLVANPPKVEDLCWCGHVDQYDETFDKLSVRTAQKLKRIDNKIFYGHVSTSDDPMIGTYAAANAAEIFATDAILAQLMSAPRSVYRYLECRCFYL
jgi:translation initiation factor 3 subunit D